MKDLTFRSEPDFSALEKGDLIEISHGIYSHWAVYIGVNDVGVHYAVHVGKTEENTGCVHSQKLDEIIADDLWRKNNAEDVQRGQKRFSEEEIVDRAKKSIGAWLYDVKSNNCEHFAKWCRYGKRMSQQTNDLQPMTVGSASQLLWRLLSDQSLDKASKLKSIAEILSDSTISKEGMKEILLVILEYQPVGETWLFELVTILLTDSPTSKTLNKYRSGDSMSKPYVSDLVAEMSVDALASRPSLYDILRKKITDIISSFIKK